MKISLLLDFKPERLYKGDIQCIGLSVDGSNASLFGFCLYLPDS